MRHCLWADPRQVNNSMRKNGACQKAKAETEEETLSTFFVLRLTKFALYYHLDTKLLCALFPQTIGQRHAEDVSTARTPLLLRLDSVDALEALVRSHAAPRVDLGVLRHPGRCQCPPGHDLSPRRPRRARRLARPLRKDPHSVRPGQLLVAVLAFSLRLDTAPKYTLITPTNGSHIFSTPQSINVFI